MRNKKKHQHFLSPVKEVIKVKLIPALFSSLQMSDQLKILMALPQNLLSPLLNTLSHNELRDNIVEMLEEKTYDVKVKPTLQPLIGE